jgi:hypothetical protein
MPSFRGVLSSEEIVAALAFIKTMWSEEVQSLQIEGSREYEAQVKEYGE